MTEFHKPPTRGWTLGPLIVIGIIFSAVATMCTGGLF